MEIKALEERIEKKQNQIAKIERSIARLEVKDPYDDLKRRRRDLEEAQKTLKNYQEQLAIEINKENAPKIEVLVNFLNQWKEKANAFYHKEAQALYKAYEEHKTNNERIETEYRAKGYSTEAYKEYREKNSEEYRRYNEVEKVFSPLIRRIRTYKDTYLNEEELEKELNREVKRKYEDLVYRISYVVGEILDCSNLYIGSNGSINGIVIGTNAKARVETITAGGYNIQCLHYRVLVNKIK